MKYLITGATGLVGKKLCIELVKNNIELVIVGRDTEEKFRDKFSLPAQYISWSDLQTTPAIHDLEGVIHLAGDPLAEGSWTKSKKQQILNSRIETTQSLVRYFQKTRSYPNFFISASAIGYYGSVDNEWLTEDSPAGQGFLADVCTQWELASQPLDEFLRLVHMRIGIVLDRAGGFLTPMQNLFANGLGAQVGNGQQHLSWIHCEDLVRMILFVAKNSKVQSKINAVAPTPVTNKEFTLAYADRLKVNTIRPAPALALKIALGEKSQLALMSQRVSSEKILKHGFDFKFNTLVEALEDIYSWQTHPMEKLFMAEQWIPKKKKEIFPYFTETKNLEEITPPWLHFNVLDQSTPQIKSGTLINYKLQIKGLPVKWRTEILDWNPPEMFSDKQLKGPYNKWYHTHLFEDLGTGTLMTDLIVYRLPLGIFGSLTAQGFVLNDIKTIFEYRKKVIKNKFG